MAGREVPARRRLVGFLAARKLWRARRRLLATGATELATFSLAFWVGINQALYGGLSPYSVNPVGVDPSGVEGLAHLERAPRLATLFVDPGLGLLRWAPVLALAFGGLFLLARSTRGGLARALPGVKESERAAGLCAAVIGVQLLVAVFLAPTLSGGAFPPRHLVAVLPLAVPLAAWGLRHVPRLGAALAVVTVALSLWLVLDTAFGDGSLLPSGATKSLDRVSARPSSAHTKAMTAATIRISSSAETKAALGAGDAARLTGRDRLGRPVGVGHSVEPRSPRGPGRSLRASPCRWRCPPGGRCC